MYLARDLSFTEDCAVAKLSVFAKQYALAYTFYWSRQQGVWGCLWLSDPKSKNPSWTEKCRFRLEWMYEQLVQFPDVFTRSNFERAGLMVAVMKLKEFSAPLPDKFGPSGIFRS